MAPMVLPPPMRAYHVKYWMPMLVFSTAARKKVVDDPQSRRYSGFCMEIRNAERNDGAAEALPAPKVR